MDQKLKPTDLITEPFTDDEDAGPPLELKRRLLPVEDYTRRQGLTRSIVEQCGKLGILRIRRFKGRTFVVDSPITADSMGPDDAPVYNQSPKQTIPAPPPPFPASQTLKPAWPQSSPPAPKAKPPVAEQIMFGSISGLVEKMIAANKPDSPAAQVFSCAKTNVTKPRPAAKPEPPKLQQGGPITFGGAKLNLQAEDVFAPWPARIQNPQAATGLKPPAPTSQPTVKPVTPKPVGEKTSVPLRQQTPIVRLQTPAGSQKTQPGKPAISVSEAKRTGPVVGPAVKLSPTEAAYVAGKAPAEVRQGKRRLMGWLASVIIVGAVAGNVYFFAGRQMLSWEFMQAKNQLNHTTQRAQDLQQDYETANIQLVTSQQQLQDSLAQAEQLQQELAATKQQLEELQDRNMRAVERLNQRIRNLADQLPNDEQAVAQPEVTER